MTRVSTLRRCERGAAGAEMALVLPLLLVLMFSGFELGNYFRDWHTLSKAVRDGARFAARNDFADFDCDTGEADETNVIDPTTDIIRTGLVGGSQDLLANFDDGEIIVEVACGGSVVTGKDADGNDLTEQMQGIYRGSADGAPVVTVTARVPYRGLFGQFGWSGAGLNLAAREQAAVMGI